LRQRNQGNPLFEDKKIRGRTEWVYIDSSVVSFMELRT